MIEIVTTDTLNQTDDFWLHRYFPSKDLIYYFDNKSINLNFSRLDTFKDNLEGWDLSNPGLKVVMDYYNSYFNYVKDNGGSILDHKETFKIYYAYANSGTRIPNLDIDLKHSINKLAEFDRIRKTTYASCWFATDKLEEENRAMWELYARKPNNGINSQNKDVHINGIRLSVKWQHLKSCLNKVDDNIKAGFVNYCLNEYKEPLTFTKEISYRFESEFRIVLTKKSDEKRQCLKINNIPFVICTLWNNKDDQSIQILHDNGFVADNNTRVLGYTNLIPEIPQIDWEEALKSLTN